MIMPFCMGWLLTEVLVPCTLETLLFLTPPTRENRVLRNFLSSRIFYGRLYVLWMYRKAFPSFPHIITLTYILIFFNHKKQPLHYSQFYIWSYTYSLASALFFPQKKKTRAIEHYSNSATFFLCVRKFILLLIFSNYTHNFHETPARPTPEPSVVAAEVLFYFMLLFARAPSLSLSS